MVALRVIKNGLIGSSQQVLQCIPYFLISRLIAYIKGPTGFTVSPATWYSRCAVYEKSSVEIRKGHVRNATRNRNSFGGPLQVRQFDFLPDFVILWLWPSHDSKYVRSFKLQPEWLCNTVIALAWRLPFIVILILNQWNASFELIMKCDAG